MNANELFAAAPELMKKWTATSLAVASSLEPALVGLVEIRASQINGCANCINMHTKDARAKGETEQRIYLLSAWREAPCYTDRERAALGWTEALTRLSEGHKLEAAREVLEAQFTREEQVKLTLMINVINGWNRIAVGFGMFVDPAEAKAAAAKAARLMADVGARGRSGHFRPAASNAHARCLSHARLRGRRRGRSAGGLHPLDGGRPRRGA